MQKAHNGHTFHLFEAIIQLLFITPYNASHNQDSLNSACTCYRAERRWKLDGVFLVGAGIQVLNWGDGGKNFPIVS